MGITEVLTLIFLVLKLTGVITWSWWYVFLPEIIGVLFYIAWFVFVTSLMSKTTKRFLK